MNILGFPFGGSQSSTPMQIHPSQGYNFGSGMQGFFNAHSPLEAGYNLLTGTNPANPLQSSPFGMQSGMQGGMMPMGVPQQQQMPGSPMQSLGQLLAPVLGSANPYGGGGGGGNKLAFLLKMLMGG